MSMSCPSPIVRRAFALPSGKVQLLPNGCDARFRRATSDLFVTTYGLRDFTLYVGHIGWGRKNVLRLLRVARRLGRPLVLIGEVLPTAYGRACLELIRENPLVMHLSTVPPGSDTLASAYAACDTLVLPSDYETPGLAALEAGLAGAKICITRFGGTKEYFGTHATYLDPRSENSIALALQASWAKPRTSALSELIARRFLWGEAAKSLAASYNRLLSSG